MALATQYSAEVFYKTQSFIFKCFALWNIPQESSKRLRIAIDIYFWHIIIFWMLLFDLSLLIKFISSITSLNEIAKIFLVFATTIAVQAKFVSVKMKSDSYTVLFNLMHTQDFRPRNSDEVEIFVRAMQLSKFVRNNYAYISLAALNSLLLTQYLIDKSELPVSAYTFISVDKTWRYCVVYFYQYIAQWICCVFNIAFDSIATSFCIYLKGQLDILSYRLENIGDNLHSNSGELLCLQLKDCVRYYAKILQMTELIESLVSIPLSVQILCSVFVLVANFYAMSLISLPDEYITFFKFLVYQICMLTQIFILCYFSNEVSLKSSQLSHSLYKSNWVAWNKINRKLMLLMMLRFDTPIQLRTINRCYSFNLPAFTSELVDNINRSIYRPQNLRENKHFIKSMYMNRRIRNSYCFLSLGSLIFNLLSPYFANSSELPLSTYTPLNMDSKWQFGIMYLYQALALSLACFINISFDSIAVAFLIVIKGQLDILGERLENLGMHFEENDEDIHLQLRKCNLFYTEIWKISEIVERLVNFSFSIQIFCSVLVLIANFYAMSFLSGPDDYVGFIKFSMYQFCMLVQIYILCHFSSEVTLKSAELSYNLYKCNWVPWSKFNRKLVLLMMLRFDTPIRIRSINRNYDFNLAAFTSIVNSSYSYFALLKKINS